MRDDPATASAAEVGDHARRMESAAALERAYLGHGDQLGQLEAEAAQAGYLRARNLRHRSLAWLRRVTRRPRVMPPP